ncbi:hypothetical protein TNCV_4043921 [Trichonephila clavipes]|nr:hypothetical protein TNCV_4043921 [Trichonephila clavipes]
MRSPSTVDDSLFLGTWTDKQSSIPYHNVFDAGLDFVAFFSLRSDMSAIGCGDGIREEGLRDDFLSHSRCYLVQLASKSQSVRSVRDFFIVLISTPTITTVVMGLRLVAGMSRVRAKVPLKARRVEWLTHVKSVEAQRPVNMVWDSERVSQLRCRPYHLAVVQNYEIRCQ